MSSFSWFNFWSGKNADTEESNQQQEAQPGTSESANMSEESIGAKRKSILQPRQAMLRQKTSTTSLASKTSGGWLSWKRDPANQQAASLEDQEDINEDEEHDVGNGEEIEPRNDDNNINNNSNDFDDDADDNGDEIDDHVSAPRRGINWFWNNTSKNSANNIDQQAQPSKKDETEDDKKDEKKDSKHEDVKEDKKDEKKDDKSSKPVETNTILTPSIPTRQELANAAKKAPVEVQQDDAVLYKPHDKAAQFNQINTHKNENLKENAIVPNWKTCLPAVNEGFILHNSSTSSPNNTNQTIRTDLKNWRQFLTQISAKFGLTANADIESQQENKTEEDVGLLYEKSYKLYGKSLAVLPQHKRACLPNYNKYYHSTDDPVSQYQEDQDDPNAITITNDAMGNLLINNRNRRKGALNAEVVNHKAGPLKKVKNVLIIGVHGFFPTRMIRPIIGAPKGTSLKFANEAEKAVIRYCVDNNLIDDDQSNVSIQKIALEKEGKIFDRVHFFTEILQKWEKELNNADFIFIASHSQGCVVSIILLARLIRMGILKDPIHKRIGLLGMAGINNGPFYGVDKSFFMKAYSAIEHESLNELFELTKFDSSQSMVYKESIRTIINVNAKICFIGSINDQLVPLYSALASHVFHPNIYRACYIDYASSTPTFIEKLVSICSNLLNLGYFDNNVVKELSTSLAGPLTGGGHSKIYNDGKVYDLGIKFFLDTDDLVIPHDGKIDYDDFDNSDLPVSNQVYIKEFNVGKIGTNPFVLPWCLRGLLFNIEKNWPTRDYVINEHDGSKEQTSVTNGFTEVHELYEDFEQWKPTAKTHKDLKFRLNGLRANNAFREVADAYEDFDPPDHFSDNEFDDPNGGDAQLTADDGRQIINGGVGPDDAATAAAAQQQRKKTTKELAIPKDERTTTPYMTKYERARILGTRALQISLNAPVLVDIEGETDPLQIAMKELSQRKIPLVIRRYLPDGSYEDWGCDELIVDQ
ncbi:hypothetical protein CANMA_003913 [Candida margitis]|uniref:uncharacterized protein n=1 Tax=Candida margitis TaxID=1775924 RepID=UPI00222765E8|nr:uncharacterized protein CANMA_003913 [Candida margitis]KAI5961139.1 hypothetical protein CANMA_003913 [Candida margitis]